MVTNEKGTTSLQRTLFWSLSHNSGTFLTSEKEDKEADPKVSFIRRSKVIFIPLGLNDLLAAYTDKSAYAQCIIAYSAGPEEEILLFTGRTPVS